MYISLDNRMFNQTNVCSRILDHDKRLQFFNDERLSEYLIHVHSTKCFDNFPCFDFIAYLPAKCLFLLMYLQLAVELGIIIGITTCESVENPVIFNPALYDTLI